MLKKLFIVLIALLCLVNCTSSEDPLVPEIEQETPEQPQEESENEEDPQNQIELPIVETTTLNGIEFDTALIGGKIVSEGGAVVTTRGFVVGTSPKPTLENSVYDLGEGHENFNERLQELTPGTTHYVRAYATNQGGTSYSEDLVFNTKSGTLMLAREFITDNIIHNPSDNIIYFTTLNKNEELNGFEESVHIVAYNYELMDVVAEREIPNLSPSPNSSIEIEVTLGQHNGRGELYVHDDTGKINILDALTLDNIDDFNPNFSPVAGGVEYLNTRIHQINDYLHFASSDSIYFYDRDQLVVHKSLANNLPNGKLTVYNNFEDNTIESVIMISSNTGTISTFKFNTQADFISRSGFGSDGGNRIIRTNDNSPVVVKGTNGFYFYKNENHTPRGELNSGNFLRDTFITDDGQNVFTITGASTLLKYDANDLSLAPTEISIQLGPEKIFQVDDQLLIIDYNENDNDFLYGYSDGMTEVYMYFTPIQQ